MVGHIVYQYHKNDIEEKDTTMLENEYIAY